MAKGYVSRWALAKEPERKFITDFWFTSSSDSAAYWPDRERAEQDLLLFENKGITIPSSEGGLHILKNFQIEEITPERFLIWCEGPFAHTAKTNNEYIDGEI